MFICLKVLLTSSPVFSTPKPRSAVRRRGGWVGHRSWHRVSDENLHPCAFFSRRLSPVEQNYNVGKRATSAYAGPARVAGLYGGICRAVCGLAYQEAKLSMATLGSFPWPLQLRPHLSPGVQEHKAQCIVMPVLH